MIGASQQPLAAAVAFDEHGVLREVLQEDLQTHPPPLLLLLDLLLIDEFIIVIIMVGAVGVLITGTVTRRARLVLLPRGAITAVGGGITTGIVVGVLLTLAHRLKRALVLLLALAAGSLSPPTPPSIMEDRDEEEVVREGTE